MRRGFDGVFLWHCYGVVLGVRDNEPHHSVTQAAVGGETVTIFVATTLVGESPGDAFGDVVTVALATNMPGPGAALPVALGSDTRRTLITAVATSLDDASPAQARVSTTDAASPD